MNKNESHEAVRNTFGLIDPLTKKRYEDILSAHLQLLYLSFETWNECGSLAESRDRNKDYAILIDHATLKELIQKGTIPCIVSFQRRTTGNYAVVRLFKTSATSQKIMEKEYS